MTASSLLSIVIRTFNEERYLDELLTAIKRQEVGSHRIETILVDSGSTDQTRAIAQSHDIAIVDIAKSEFTFGRSLNLGCESANGDILVFVSGHCIPEGRDWLLELCTPILEGTVDYVGGRQKGRDSTKYSEHRVFHKYFPDQSLLPREGYFVNNANAALSRQAWAEFGFDEDLTGLEDMHLAKRMVSAGRKIGYQSKASVFHIHDETWSQVRWRYEREAMALKTISPELSLSFVDFLRCVYTGIVDDCTQARNDGVLQANFFSIAIFRSLQYWGSYRGSQHSRKLNRQLRRHYFYPTEAVEPYSTEIDHPSETDRGKEQ